MIYSVFDSLFDSTIVIDENRKIVYCNETAAALAGSSVRRLSKGVVFSDIFLLNAPGLFPVDGGEIGKESSMPMEELDFTIKNSERQGKLQVTIQPFSEGEAAKRWIIMMHDVTLEETLHKKYQGELEQKEVYINELKQAKSQLEDYSKNLEKMVEERTQQVRQANRMLNAIMNSLGQGFLVFDQEGVCSDVYTRACESILESVPVGKPIWQVLNLSHAELEQMKMWMKAAFSESLPFESLVDLAPSQYQHSANKHITLNYYPIRNEKEKIANIVLVATDRTREYEAEQALAKEQQYIQMVLKVIKNREQFRNFLKSVRTLLDSIKQDLTQKKSQFDFAEAFRTLHTLEGEAGLFSVGQLRTASRHCQELLEPFKQGLEFDREQVISDLYKRVLELETEYNNFLQNNEQLLSVIKTGDERVVEISAERLLQFAKELEQAGAAEPIKLNFTETILRQPLELYLNHFDEVVRHVAEVQGKMVNPLQFACSGVRIIPGSLDALISSLVHAFRNAVDHGIEAPADRLESGKAQAGTLKISAEFFMQQKTRWVRLSVADDGGGINPERVRQKLVNLYPNQGYESKAEQEVIQGIFLAGFSSKDSVGQFSGRGIGMDAIKTEVERLGGKVWVESKVSVGTTLYIEFPDRVSFDSIALAA